MFKVLYYPEGQKSNSNNAAISVGDSMVTISESTLPGTIYVVEVSSVTGSYNASMQSRSNTSTVSE